MIFREFRDLICISSIIMAQFNIFSVSEKGKKKWGGGGWHASTYSTQSNGRVNLIFCSLWKAVEASPYRLPLPPPSGLNLVNLKQCKTWLILRGCMARVRACAVVDLDLKVTLIRDLTVPWSDHTMRSPSLIEDADKIARSVGLRENILTNGHDGALG